MVHGRFKLEVTGPIVCCAPDCAKPATILHKLKPYCGKHALELLESGEGFERRIDYIPSVPPPSQ